MLPLAFDVWTLSVEANTGPRARASAPSARNTPITVPFWSSRPYTDTIVVRLGTTVADAWIMCKKKVQFKKILVSFHFDFTPFSSAKQSHQSKIFYYQITTQWMWIGQKLILWLLMIGILMLILTKLSVLVSRGRKYVKVWIYGLVDKREWKVHF